MHCSTGYWENENDVLCIRWQIMNDMWVNCDSQGNLKIKMDALVCLKLCAVCGET